MKIFLVVIAIIVGVLLIVPAFINKDITISRTIEINKPVDQVYNVVKDFNYYKQWNAWSQMDKDAKGEITGPAGEVGTKWSWDGDTVGVGSLTIEELEPNQSITSKLEFISPMTAEAQDLWDFEMVDSSTTKITWTYAGTTDSYFMRYMNPMMEGMLAPDIETGLNNLKTLVEGLPEPEPEMAEDEE
jgi:uncharacterized protein YndB with AHSA1/START domain